MNTRLPTEDGLYVLTRHLGMLFRRAGGTWTYLAGPRDHYGLTTPGEVEDYLDLALREGVTPLYRLVQGEEWVPPEPPLEAGNLVKLTGARWPSYMRGLTVRVEEDSEGGIFIENVGGGTWYFGIDGYEYRRVH